MKKSLIPSAMILLAGLFFCSARAHAAAGDLDPSFNLDGLVTTDVPDPASSSLGQAAALQDDGKIVVVGITSFGNDDFAVVRYNPDGSLDTSFGTGGIVTTNFSGSGPTASADGASAVVIQSNDGRIVVGGFSGDEQRIDIDFALARYNTDGSLDPSFGSGGLVVTDFLGIQALDLIHGLALQSDGKIVAAGDTNTTFGASPQNFAIARYNTDGSLDTSFNPGGALPPGIAGEIQTSFTGSSDDVGQAVQIQPDGQIVVAGSSNVLLINSQDDFAVARYNPNGSLDPSFGTGGLVTTNFFTDPIIIGVESQDIAFDLVIQPDGNIVLAGSYFTSSPQDGQFALARYQPNGNLDGSFGSGGLVLTGFTDLVTNSLANGNGIDLYANGKLVVSGGVGTVLIGGQFDFAVARYNDDGSLDPAFGSGGKVNTPFPGNNFSSSTDVLIQPDGKVVAAGSAGFINIPSGTSTNLGFAVARYLGDVADLSIEKTANVTEASLNESFTYNLEVTNLGPDPAGGVTVSDTLPASLQIQDVNPSQGTCTTTGQDVECELGNLAVGDSANIQIQVLPTATTDSLVNTATVEGQVEDPVLGNNISTLILSVIQPGLLEGSGLHCGLNSASGKSSTAGMIWFLLAVSILGMSRAACKNR